MRVTAALAVAAFATASLTAAPQVAGAECSQQTVQQAGDATHTLAVVAGHAGIVARQSPHPDAAVVGRFAARTPEGVSSVFMVRDQVLGAGCRPTWFRVLLPQRPNGASGWVPATGLARYVVRTRIVIDVSRRRLELWRAGRLQYAFTVAVGRHETPTPIGLYYVVERLYTDDPGGAYGPAALGLSAFSPVLTRWTRGGPIGIHGTNEPSSIGQPASNGCIRVPNARILRLLHDVSAGTPVLIHP